MKFTTLLAPVAILASTVAADAASIQTALDTINLSTLKLKNYVDTWNGKLLTVIPIVSESTSLLANINRGTKTAEASEELDTLGALGVGQKTSTLATSVNQTITAIIASKPKFDKLLLSPTILLNLKLEKKATEEMSEAIVSKIPELFRDFAKSLTVPIFESFDEAIETYKLF
ncbi:hydrophobic surface binding protein A-domain-containing protein [Neurospora tetraspora]|uniref:Hydrophobic surface binding protein A-domain-containing protein n=1 Tax=Neurospora tetraspora TaxID=94610 RepID=A0AAE0JA88_9PEZI|nr:hydrophobic surface binding protein A-domain-containing protein [Neurospora tetraspora]